MSRVRAAFKLCLVCDQKLPLASFYRRVASVSQKTGKIYYTYNVFCISCGAKRYKQKKLEAKRGPRLPMPEPISVFELPRGMSERA